MDERAYKEVYFYQYCATCKHENVDEGEDICNECLENFVNLNSHKPVNWKEKEENA